MYLFPQILTAFSLTFLLGTIAYHLYATRREVRVFIRAEALAEVREALQSLAYVAGDAAMTRQRDGLDNTESARRAFYYQRAVNIIASIPVTR